MTLETERERGGRGKQRERETEGERERREGEREGGMEGGGREGREGDLRPHSIQNVASFLSPGGFTVLQVPTHTQPYRA